MKHLAFDSLGGASGDMILAALFDLGVEPEPIAFALRSLHIGDFHILPSPASDHGLRGTRVTVSVPKTEGDSHRHLPDILARVADADLPVSVREMSGRVFRCLAEAEGRVHGVPAERVHFHEVGAADSIVDVVGACLALNTAGVESVSVGVLPLGNGTVPAEHGLLPVPAPATVELLRGHPVVRTDEPSELVTPTGAALLMTWKDVFPDRLEETPMNIHAVGHGLGTRALARRPNLLRATLFTSDSPADADTDQCLVLECNLDDTVPELLGSLARKLLAHGALDVFTTPIQMKKQRPGVLLSVLAQPHEKDHLLDLIFAESTTFGVREHLAARTMLRRRHMEVKTPYGMVRVKIGSWKGRDITRAPEHDDCVRCAEEHGVAVRAVYESALRAL